MVERTWEHGSFEAQRDERQPCSASPPPPSCGCHEETFSFFCAVKFFAFGCQTFPATLARTQHFNWRWRSSYILARIPAAVMSKVQICDFSLGNSRDITAQESVEANHFSLQLIQLRLRLRFLAVTARVLWICFTKVRCSNVHDVTTQMKCYQHPVAFFFILNHFCLMTKHTTLCGTD